MQEDEEPSSVDGLRDHLGALLRNLRSSRSDASCPERLIGKRKTSSRQLPTLPSDCVSLTTLSARFPGLLRKLLHLSAFPGWAELCHLFWDVYCEAWSDAEEPEAVSQIESYVRSLSAHSLLDCMEGLELTQYLLLLMHLSTALTRSKSIHAALFYQLTALQVDALKAFQQMKIPLSCGLFFISGVVSGPSRDGIVASHALQVFNHALSLALRSDSSRSQAQAQEISLAAMEPSLSSLLLILSHLSFGLRSALLGLCDNDTDVFQALITIVQLEARLNAAVHRFATLSVLKDLDTLLSRTCSTSADLFLFASHSLLYCDLGVVIDLLISPETDFLLYLLSFCKHFHWSDVVAAAARCTDLASVANIESAMVGSARTARGTAKAGVIIWTSESVQGVHSRVPAPQAADKDALRVHPSEWTVGKETCVSPSRDDQVEDRTPQRRSVDSESLQALCTMLHSLADKLHAMHRLGLLPFEPAVLCARLGRFLSS